jgi:hypothetical protein
MREIVLIIEDQGNEEPEIRTVRDHLEENDANLVVAPKEKD